MEKLYDEAKDLQGELVEMRRTLHRSPEIGLSLPKTTALVKEKLESLGLEPKLVGESGLSVTIGKSGKCFLIRGDMDALPIKEEAEVAFKSENENMHACGHDFHTAMLYGAAKLLKEHEDELAGTVKLMFQPGEEILQGAKVMVEEGILENPKVDAAAMIHVFPGLPLKSGTVLVPEAGPFASTSDWFEIKIQGKGGHAAMPELSINPLTVMSHIHLALHALEAREISMYDSAVISTTIMEGGVVDNAIPDTAYMRGTIRTFDDKVRKFIFKRIPEIAEGIAQSFGATVEAKIIEGCPTVEVDGTVSADIREALEKVFPGDITSPDIVGMNKLGGSEDFSYVTQEVPSTMLLLSSGHSAEGYPYFVHHPKVVFDEDVLSKGAAVYAISAMEWLKKNQ
ncbi:M20 metallopeptidase family protein [Enterococcus sp. BWR-S5]|uniref:M20 metallopeptidase family protein n=1 Tax=Enterococcus sp. BWR-S5 TaxID=2787714 RepID=UPI00192446BC|nr:M20 family metallopeptidase [Enterococcus sp. BWR-S5]MBL1226711.1 amidohydrolase [Enterococcus sp. BWR-S5]